MYNVFLVDIILEKQNKIDDLESLKERILLLESQRLEIQEHIKNLKARKLVFYGETKSSNTGCPNTSTRKPSITIPIKDKFLLIRFDLFIFLLILVIMSFSN